ncbi:chemotaxis response regulator protein-glutamate methylesterase [Paenibacillus sp. NFR01]|uniref:protein-glutamate methylesterase/protein-glutamine glutaminase n=1 Tax=Paenibacillus sp. NFR01 TaxID=1566279 RepID=UPI0008B6933E|nr:chemotaxis response regulator protein-glutamate methylesterase [Paenibacillus sp. NFR01]SET43132.1 two-component system, chemotaxis family, response regulator CheB [Paenibacillus sp. NFR01]
MKPYRVLVVDDSAFMRKIISDLIEKDPGFQVAGTAVNGREAIEKVAELLPDLVTMDVEMPEMNGLEALKIIMDRHPLPVIMLSGINEEGMKETIMALEWGAFDFIRKPSIGSSQDIIAVGESLREQMKEAMLARKRREERASFQAEAAATASPPEPAQQTPQAPAAQEQPAASSKPPQAPVLPPQTRRQPDGKAKPSGGSAAGKAAPGPLQGQRPTSPAPGRARSGPAEAPAAPAADKSRSQVKPPAARPAKPSLAEPPAAQVPASPPAASRRASGKGLQKLVAVGCSTGGPRALKALLENIPGDFPAPIVIVQHMPPNFTKSLAQRLNTFSPLAVDEAVHGTVLKVGAAYIAPGGFHMKVVPAGDGEYKIELTKEDARNGHRPSVDTMFESLLPLTGLERHAVIMTGMGSDGARMMKSLYDSGVTSTFAESEETCVVYGMPRSAVELQCVRYILPLQEIAPRLVQAVK